MAFLNKKFASNTSNITIPTEEVFEEGIKYKSPIYSNTINGYLYRITEAVIDLQNQPSEVNWNGYTSIGGNLTTPYNYNYSVLPYADEELKGNYNWYLEETRAPVPEGIGLTGTALYANLKGSCIIRPERTTTANFRLPLPLVAYATNTIYELSYASVNISGQTSPVASISSSFLAFSVPLSAATMAVISFDARYLVDTSGRPPAPSNLTSTVGENNLITLDWEI